MLSLPVEKGLLVFLINWSFCSLRRCLSAPDIYTHRERRKSRRRRKMRKLGRSSTERKGEMLWAEGVRVMRNKEEEAEKTKSEGQKEKNKKASEKRKHKQTKQRERKKN